MFAVHLVYKNLNNFRQERDMSMGLVPFYWAWNLYHYTGLIKAAKSLVPSNIKDMVKYQFIYTCIYNIYTCTRTCMYMYQCQLMSKVFLWYGSCTCAVKQAILQWYMYFNGELT